MHELARKNFLAKNLNKMQKLYPKDYDFYPKTWLYPTEFSSLKSNTNKKSVYIVKPEASSQGKGIFLTKKLEGFDENERYVIQEYIQNPMLIDGLKFDMRIYVLLAGCDPLKIFLHKEGLGRFATETYTKPNSYNLENHFIHLTNYAINKNNDNFVFNSDPNLDNVGHKKSLTATFEKIKAKGFDTEKLWQEIEIIIVKTLCSAQPSLAHLYKACQADDPYNGMCFEILGFDIILDNSGKPWLLEVNHSPSFNIDSPLDFKIKSQVISEALILLNINPENRKEFKERKKKQILFRSLARNKNLEKENKKNDFANAQIKRSLWESSHLGSYFSIYPDPENKFARFLEAAMKIWIESTGGKFPIKSTRPKSQDTEVKISLKTPTDLSNKNCLAVFERLYKVKKLKIEQHPVPACVHLDDQFKTNYIKSQTPYSFIELVLPKGTKGNSRYKSLPKKRISNYSQHLDEVLREKRTIETLKRTFNHYETPLQICSVVADCQDAQKSKLFKLLVSKRII